MTLEAAGSIPVTRPSLLNYTVDIPWRFSVFSVCEPFIPGSILETWVTVSSGDIGNTFSHLKGLQAGSILRVSSSKYPISNCIKDTRQILSSTSLIPTLCPASTLLTLIF